MAVRLTTPVSIVTGFLGSGKTTLINRILREKHDQRIAIIENEYGAVGVDAEFLVTERAETVIQLANGCLCCTVRGDLARALHAFVIQAEKGGFAFDRVLIETTGIADPGPIIQTFLAETTLLNHFHLDGVITLIDGVHGESQFSRVENQAQIGYADRVLLSKSDLISAAQREVLRERIAAMNARADLLPVDIHSAGLGELIGLLFDTQSYRFDYVARDELQRYANCAPSSNASLSIGPPASRRPRHTADVVSCVFESETALDRSRLNDFFDALQLRYGNRLWRYKGIVHVSNERPGWSFKGCKACCKSTLVPCGGRSRSGARC